MSRVARNMVIQNAHFLMTISSSPEKYCAETLSCQVAIGGVSKASCVAIDITNSKDVLSWPFNEPVPA